MKPTDWLVLALQTFVGFVTVVGALESRGGEEGVFYLLATLAVFVSALLVVGRTRQREPAVPQPSAPALDLDARQILDLDARLEALEAAQGDADDAAKWRALVASGQASAPAPPAGEDAGRGPARRQSA